MFDFVYRPFESAYAWLVRQLLKIWWLLLIIFVVVTVGTFFWFNSLPTGFLPEEDEGYSLIAVQLPDGASLDRTHEVVSRMNKVFERYREKGLLDNWFVLGGISLLDGTNAPNGATAFPTWTDWSVRTTEDKSQRTIVRDLQMELAQMQEAFILVIVPPSIQGLGFGGGFQMQIEDREGVGLEALQERTQAVIDEARKHPEINPMRTATSFRAGVPQVFLNIDRVKAEKMGVLASDIFACLQANLGSVYVNDFNKFGRTYQVRVQADARYRTDAKLLTRLEVRNREGNRVPLGTLLSVESQVGPLSVNRYNLYPCASINGLTNPEFSSGQGLKVMEEVAADVLPKSMGFDWTAIAFQEKRVSGQAVYVFGFAVLLVYFVLAAQYESWILPLSVILVVPLGLLGVVCGVSLRGMDNNTYTQIGIVLIIALASKNAILIVEFARELRLSGRSIREAAIEASRLRFRPILMTSIAFILGVVPLVTATGAGAASRRALGTAVFGGMISSTFLAVIFVPVFYVAFQYLIELFSGPPKPRAGEVIPVH